MWLSGAMERQVKPREWAIDRGGLEIIPGDVCQKLLEASEVGRIAFVAAGSPVVLPVNFRFYARRIVFRSTVGSKLNAAAMGDPVAFEIDDWDARTRTGWSVMVRGRAAEVTDAALLAELYDLGLRPWADPTLRTRWVQVLPSDIDGRRIPRRSVPATAVEAAPIG